MFFKIFSITTSFVNVSANYESGCIRYFHAALHTGLPNTVGLKLKQTKNWNIINSFTGSSSWNRHDSNTAKPYILQKCLLQSICSKFLWVVTWAWPSLTSQVWGLLEAKNTIFPHTLWQFKSTFGSSHSTSSSYQEMRSVITFSLHSAFISRILEPSPQDLISSNC